MKLKVLRCDVMRVKGVVRKCEKALQQGKGVILKSSPCGEVKLKAFDVVDDGQVFKWGCLWSV